MTDKLIKSPYFYGIGVQKAGTTWLHAQLVNHQNVFMPKLKEIQYFNHLYIPSHRKWTDRHRIRRLNQICDYQKTLKNNDIMMKYLDEAKTNRLDDDWYLNFFSLAKDEQISGEVTPEYSLLPKEGIKHMLQLNPNAKFILLLRHPVERDFSHAKMILKGQGELKDTNEINDEIENRLLKILEMRGVYARSDYKTIIEKWKANIPDEKNLFIGFYDWVQTRPHDLLNDVCDFLDIPYNKDYFKKTDKIVFKGNSLKMTDNIRESLIERHQGTINFINKDYGESHGINWI